MTTGLVTMLGSSSSGPSGDSGDWSWHGISTAVLEGGDGPPVVLLHGPGEFAANGCG